MNATFLTNNCNELQGAPVQTEKRLTFSALVTWLKLAYQVHHQRRALVQLTDRQLNDINLTRAQAHHEACKPFWDLPSRAV